MLVNGVLVEPSTCISTRPDDSCDISEVIELEKGFPVHFLSMDFIAFFLWPLDADNRSLYSLSNSLLRYLRLRELGSH